MLRHPNKHIQGAIEYAEQNGWTFTKAGPRSHDYGALTPEAAVHAATGLAAVALDLDGEIGTLEVGKRGDVLVVSGDVTADIRALTSARAVLRDGIVVAGNGAAWEQGAY